MYFYWTDERTVELRRLNELGWSASQIAREMGSTSRSAVIGKLSRMGVKSKNAPKWPRGNTTPPAHRPQRNGGAVIAKLKAEQARKEREIASRTNDTRARSALIARARALGELDPLIPFGPIPLRSDNPRVPLLELNHGECRWPMGEVGAVDFGFCAAPAVAYGDGNIKPYCAEHARMAYVADRRTQNISDAERERRRRKGKKLYADIFGQST